MEKKHLCLTCIYYEQSTEPTYRAYWRFGTPFITGEAIRRYCSKNYTTIRKLRYTCKDHVSVYQTKLEVEGENMVKITELPTEGERVDLDNLPDDIELIAIDERVQAHQSGKTGGIIVTYKMRDGRTFPQKYSKVSGDALRNALTELGYEFTDPLFKNWHKYKLTPMRVGYPRMIPYKLVK